MAITIWLNIRGGMQAKRNLKQDPEVNIRAQEGCELGP